MDIYEYVCYHKKLLDQIPNFVGVDTLDHKYAYANDKTAQLMGFKDSYSIAGVNFADVRCKVAEDSAFFENENNIVINNHQKISVLGFHYYSSAWKLVLGEKSPLINDDAKLIGVLVCFMDITKACT